MENYLSLINSLTTWLFNIFDTNHVLGSVEVTDAVTKIYDIYEAINNISFQEEMRHYYT